MNLDNACMYLNISPDDEDLNLDEINRNYHDKLNLYDPDKKHDLLPFPQAFLHFFL